MIMFTAALNGGLVERFNLQGQRLGEVVCSLKHCRLTWLVRFLNTHWNPETPAYDIQQACGTGLQAACGETKSLWVKFKVL